MNIKQIADDEADGHDWDSLCCKQSYSDGFVDGANYMQHNSGIKYCQWIEDADGNWETECGNMHIFIDGAPKENKYKYCPYCGKEIK